MVREAHRTSNFDINQLIIVLLLGFAAQLKHLGLRNDKAFFFNFLNHFLPEKDNKYCISKQSLVKFERLYFKYGLETVGFHISIAL